MLKPVVADSGSSTSYPEAPALGIDVEEPGAASLDFTELPGHDALRWFAASAIAGRLSKYRLGLLWTSRGWGPKGDQNHANHASRDVLCMT